MVGWLVVVVVVVVVTVKVIIYIGSLSVILV